MARKNRIKKLIQEGGFTIDSFVENVAAGRNLKKKLIRKYIESGNLPNLQNKDLFYTFAMARVLGMSFPDLFIR